MKVFTAGVMVAVFLCASAAASIQRDQEERTFEGQLVNIDKDSRTLIVKAKESDKEMEFAVNEKTEVVGPQKDGQPVVVRPGSKMKIRYRFDQKVNLATRIEVSEP